MPQIEVVPVQDNNPAANSLFDRSQELTNKIRERAYQLFEARCGEHGHDLEDWCQAEREVLGALAKEEHSQSPSGPVSKPAGTIQSKSTAA